MPTCCASAHSPLWLWNNSLSYAQALLHSSIIPPRGRCPCSGQRLWNRMDIEVIPLGPFWGSLIAVFTALTGGRLASISVTFHSLRDKLGLKTCWDNNTVMAVKGGMVWDAQALPCLLEVQPCTNWAAGKGSWADSWHSWAGALVLTQEPCTDTPCHCPVTRPMHTQIKALFCCSWVLEHAQIDMTFKSIPEFSSRGQVTVASGLWCQFLDKSEQFGKRICWSETNFMIHSHSCDSCTEREVCQ